MFRGVGGGRCLVCGDFNLDLSGYENCSLIQFFVNSNYEHFLYSLINILTRISSHSATVIDHIRCNFVLGSYLTSRDLLPDISVFILCLSDGDREASNDEVTSGRIHEHKRTFVRQLFAAKFVGLHFWYS